MYKPDVRISKEPAAPSPTKVLDVIMVVDPEAYTYDDEWIKEAEAMGKSGLVDINMRKVSFVSTCKIYDAIKATRLPHNAIEVLKLKLDAVHLSKDDEEAND
ncbi:hypothetical protein ACFX2I_030917 [Malus domestica]